MTINKRYIDRFCSCETPKDKGFPVIHINIGEGSEARWVKMTGEDYLLWDVTWKDCMLRITDDLDILP